MSRKFTVSVVTARKERKQSMEWLRDEWARYADPKFDEDRPLHDVEMRREGVQRGCFWSEQVLQYVHRADILGLDTPRGRQALIKGLAAYHGMVESMYRVYGEPPKPGYPSGEIHE